MEALKLPHGTLRLLRGDITEQEVDAVVNAANSSLLGGGGVDGAIHRKGGPEILKECRRIRAERYPEGLPTGEAVATGAGRLPTRWVIHTVGPMWQGGGAGEPELLSRAYANSLRCARDLDARTLAFPSISTGAYGFPVERAAEIALGTIAGELRSGAGTLQEARFILFSDTDLKVYRSALQGL